MMRKWCENLVMVQTWRWPCLRPEPDSSWPRVLWLASWLWLLVLALLR